jgi:pseudouridine-5'-phosphate glycosidase
MKNIIISKEVQNAINCKIPVVALETTIISHGMPRPKNVEVALEVENIIRKNGCIPATIGIIDGVIKVGLSKEEIYEFGVRDDIIKVSRRDLPFVVSKKKWGSTTVAATMIVCSMVGINFFVTGGIGGVHREYDNILDISADLDELAKTNVNVVCAGVKAILDVPNTLEYLETKGVCVIGYKSDELAAFYSSKSGIKLEYSFDSEIEIANMIKTKNELGLREGVLISVPIPTKYEIPNIQIEKYIKIALDKAKLNNISGKRITPFLLKEITNLSNGRSLEANIHLIYNNAYVGSLLAKSYTEIVKNENI